MFATAGSWLVDRCGDAWRWLTHDGRWRTYLVLVALLTVVVVLGVTDQKILIWYACFALFGWLVHHERMIERARHRPGDDPRQRTAFATILLGIGVALILVGLANQQIAFFVGVALGVIAGGMLYSEFRRWRGPGHALGPIMMLVALALLVVAIVVRPVAIFGLLVLAAVFLGELGTERASEDSHEVASTADPAAARPSVNGAIVAGAGLLLLLVGFSLLVAVGTSPTAGLLVLGVLAVFVVLAIMDSDSALIVTLIAIVLAIAIQPPTESPDKAHRAVVDKPYFLVLGDSYISGEGADQFLAGTNTKTPNADHTNECRQSNSAWPFELARRAEPADAGHVPDHLLFLGCSGAVSENINVRPRLDADGAQQGPAELALYRRDPATALGHRPAFVILSVGGNDAGFGELGQSCIGPGDCTEVAQQFLNDPDRKDTDHVPTFVHGAPGLGRAEPLASIDDDLDLAYNEVREVVGPGVPVIVAPYVQPFADTAHCDGVLFSRDERQFLSGFVGELDAVIRTAARRHGFFYLSTLPGALRRHHVALCDTAAAGLNVIAPNPQGGTVADRLSPANWTHNSIHPNSIGHQAIADAAEAWFHRHPALHAPRPQPDAHHTVASLASLMGGRVVVQCGEGIECRVTGRHWLFAQVHALYAHAIVPVAISVLGLWLLILPLAWIGRRRSWTVGRLFRILWNRTAWLRAPTLRTRLGSTVLLLGGAAIALAIVGWVSGFPTGYNAAQGTGACALDPKQVLGFLDGTGTDLALYIPAYLVVVFGAVMATSRIDPGDRIAGLFSDGGWSDGAALVLAAAVGIADVVETLCFRGALVRLLHGDACRDLTGWTDVARLAGEIKSGLAAALVLLIIARVLRPVTTDDAPGAAPIAAAPAAAPPVGV